MKKSSGRKKLRKLIRENKAKEGKAKIMADRLRKYRSLWKKAKRKARMVKESKRRNRC